MSVWWCVPSARPVEEVEPLCKIYRERGYKIAMWRDADASQPMYIGFDGVTHFEATYPGYAQAVNSLALEVLHNDSSCDWIVTGGDDTLPEPRFDADDIAMVCTSWFKGTFGVMQPTGDRFAGGSIDRIAGSPWMGREWCLRANGGRGPFWPEFTHMFGDECLKRTAEKLGVYWARPDLTHFHNHFQRATDAIDSVAISMPVPPHLVKWNTKQHWDEMLAIFRRLEAEDFKSCLPITL